MLVEFGEDDRHSEDVQTRRYSILQGILSTMRSAIGKMFAARSIRGVGRVSFWLGVLQQTDPQKELPAVPRICMVR